MFVTQKMFVYSSFVLVVVLVFAQAIPVPVSEEVHPEYRQFGFSQVVGFPSEPQVSVIEVVEPAAAVRPVRSASPFFGLLGGYERPHKKQHNHHHYNTHEEYEPEYHRPQHHKPQHHQQQQGGGAGSFASAGSFAGGHGGGHSQSAANSQSASFGFGPFQASYSASSAHSGSHSNVGFSDYD
ncbi:SKI/DACH domain-containing protein 1-like [Sipha flava]|uniref:SKI/DACH domain-containing protein 1-like n=1 Tax=Sipha flava TaxID=143950 RepID=A0A8B8GH52_9HEMI|nr:SKI/DACH domain-containing protein 1-like [Sipha flava]